MTLVLVKLGEARASFLIDLLQVAFLDN